MNAISEFTLPDRAHFVNAVKVFRDCGGVAEQYFFELKDTIISNLDISFMKDDLLSPLMDIVKSSHGLLQFIEDLCSPALYDGRDVIQRMVEDVVGKCDIAALFFNSPSVKRIFLLHLAHDELISCVRRMSAKFSEPSFRELIMPTYSVAVSGVPAGDLAAANPVPIISPDLLAQATAELFSSTAVSASAPTPTSSAPTDMDYSAAVSAPAPSSSVSAVLESAAAVLAPAPTSSASSSAPAGKPKSGRKAGSSAKRRRTGGSDPEIATKNKFACLENESDSIPDGIDADDMDGSSGDAPENAVDMADPIDTPVVPKKVKVESFLFRTSSNWRQTHHALNQFLGESIKCKLAGEELVRVFPTSVDMFRKVQQFVETTGAEASFNQPRKERPAKVLIRGLEKSYGLQEVRDCLTNLGFQVKEISRLRSRKSAERSYLNLVLVKLLRTEDWVRIYAVKDICDTGVQVLSFKQNAVRQCYRCQRYNHHSAGCTLPPRCVKCGQGHLSRDCPKAYSEPCYCCNCHGAHPANYSKCPANPKMMAAAKKSKGSDSGLSSAAAPSAATSTAPSAAMGKKAPSGRKLPRDISGASAAVPSPRPFIEAPLPSSSAWPTLDEAHGRSKPNVVEGSQPKAADLSGIVAGLMKRQPGALPSPSSGEKSPAAISGSALPQAQRTHSDPALNAGDPTGPECDDDALNQADLDVTFGLVQAIEPVLRLKISGIQKALRIASVVLHHFPHLNKPVHG